MITSDHRVEHETTIVTNWGQESTGEGSGGGGCSRGEIALKTQDGVEPDNIALLNMDLFPKFCTVIPKMFHR